MPPREEIDKNSISRSYMDLIAKQVPFEQGGVKTCGGFLGVQSFQFHLSSGVFEKARDLSLDCLVE